MFSRRAAFTPPQRQSRRSAAALGSGLERFELCSDLEAALHSAPEAPGLERLNLETILVRIGAILWSSFFATFASQCSGFIRFCPSFPSVKTSGSKASSNVGRGNFCQIVFLANPNVAEIDERKI